MPIDVEKAKGTKIAPAEGSWSPDDVILYHLGIGAGLENPLDPKELEYTYEKNLKVLPSFGIVPAARASMGGRIPGMQFKPASVLHGEQEIQIHKPIPVATDFVSTARVADIFDKGKAAVFIIEVETKDKNGELLFTNRFINFARGEGGFGGDSGPKAAKIAPEGEPDAIAESRTMSHQAFLYRLNGDKNPLPVDPEISAMGGFDVPILHGLCSYGIVCKAVVDTLFDGDVAKVSSYAARFSGIVFPGETIVTKMWKEDGRIVITAETKERGTPVISNCVMTLRD